MIFFDFQRSRIPSRSRGASGLSTYFKNVDKKLAHLILDEIMDQGPPVQFQDIGKSVNTLAVIWLSVSKIQLLSVSKLR